MNTIIEFKAVDILQKNNIIFQNINFKISAGEFIYIIGKTGSGKSSLLKSLYAELPIKKGNIKVLDCAVEDLNDDNICNLSDLNVDYDSEGNVIPGDTTPVPIQDYPCSDLYYDDKSESTIYLSTIECTSEDDWCNEGEVYNHIQYVWEVRVSDEENNLHGIFDINLNADPEDIITTNIKEENKLITSIYPNPIHKKHDSHILYALGTNYTNTTLELINIKGQIVKTVSLQFEQKGWHRENINNLISPEAATGIYIIRLRSDNRLGRTQKIIILP